MFIFFSGFHQNSENCDSEKIIQQIFNVLKIANHFPKTLNFKIDWKIERDELLPNGGWSDIRDHNLCLSFANSNNETDKKISI